MSVNSGALVLSLLYSIEVSKYDFQVFLVLIEEGAFYDFGYFVHFFETDFLFLLIETILIEIFNKITTVLDIKIDLFIVILSLVCH
jgi:hypothetical protein